MIVSDEQRTEAAWMLNPATMAERLNEDGRVNYPHIDLIARENIASVLDPDVFVHVTQTQNQIGKSSTVAEGCVTWLLELFPTLPVMVGSHSKDLSRKTGRAVRNNFQNNPDKLSTRIAIDSKAADRWNTTAGGSLLATSVGGGVGWPATVFVGDDLLKNFIMAQNPANRQKAIDWLMGDVIGKLRKHRVRIPDDSKKGYHFFTIYPTILLPATRYHLDDPSGRMIEMFPDRHRVTHLPGIADSKITPDGDPLGRKDGEVVCPDFYSKAEMERLRDIMDEVTFATMVQGTPRNLTGGTINRDRWVWAKQAPDPEQRILTFTSWDLTFIETGASWVVGQYWTAMQSPTSPTLFDLYLLDQIRRKADFIDQRLIVRAFLQTHPDATHHLIENKANGPAIIRDLSLPWIDTTFDGPEPGELRRSKAAAVGFGGPRKWPAVQGIIPVDPSTSKLARVLDISRLVHDGRVFLPEWWEPTSSPRYPGDVGDDPLQQFPHSLINEAADMPYGATDDEIDTCTQAVSWARDFLTPLLTEGNWGEANVPRIASNTSRYGRR